MKKAVLLFSLLLSGFPIFAQNGFYFENGRDKVSIPFKLINNLVFIPIKVNGVELNFLLDSGVEETVLFSLEDKKEVNFYNIEKITLKGLGSEEAIEGLKSTNNNLNVNGLKSSNHLLYVILDQSFNLSSHIGIPVNGIIGYSFFKNNLVELNYQKKRVVVYQNSERNRIKFEKKFKTIAITIEKAKPYLISSVVIDTAKIPAKLLVDVGNSDAIWLFENRSDKIKVPAKHFEDYLGKGFSGDVEGKRAKINRVYISDFEFKRPIVSFPDSSSVKNVKIVEGRLGSVGGEILKRFTVVFDYSGGKMFLKKNYDFNAPFTYNKSGIEIQHHGLQWVQETVKLETVPLMGDNFDAKGDKMTNNFRYKFQLKPVYEIANIRKNSPAANCGLQSGDVLITVNKEPAYKYSLQEINLMLKSEEDKWITLEIERDSQILKFRFQLLDMLK